MNLNNVGGERGFYSIHHVPPAPAAEVIESVPSVCVSVRLSALSQLNRLTYGQEIWHVGRPGPYLGQLWGQVKGHQMRKCDFRAILLTFLIWKARYKTLAYHVMSGHLVMPQLDVMPSRNITKRRHWAKGLWKYLTQEVGEHSGVFIHSHWTWFKTTYSFIDRERSVYSTWCKQRVWPITITESQ